MVKARAFIPCPVCTREVQIVPHAGGLRYRIHTGRLTKWCAGSHRSIEGDRPATFTELAHALAAHRWVEVADPLIVVPLWDGGMA